MVGILNGEVGLGGPRPSLRARPSLRTRVQRGPHLQWLLACVVGIAVAVPALAADFENPKAGKPPKAKPNRQTAAEGVPPLPLPATPIRRSEKKREPAPPGLIGMINFSDTRALLQDGKRVETAAFPTTQIDIERLINVANFRLNVRYRYMPITLEKFSWDPQELPILYLTGWTEMPRLSDPLLDRLRRYLYDGGTLVVHAQCGREEFVNSARREIARLMPNRRLAPLDTDSPLFSAYVPIKEMRFRKDDGPFKSIPPYLEAVYLGLRPAVIFSPIDLNCGWDVENNPIQGGILYHQNDAVQLGLNIITVALANFQYARAWGVQKVYPQEALKSRDQLVLAQIVHNGDWDPTPHALPALLKHIQSGTTLNVQFKREVLNLGETEVFKYPVLYMTGLRDFKFSNVEVARLKNYLASGGVLVADAAAGSRAFDVAFRRELKRFAPGELKALPQDSPLYQTPYKIRNVDYSDLVRSRENVNVPVLETVTVDGQLSVIYSPYGLAAGWEQLGFAYNRGVADSDALRLGVNILAYAMMH